MIRKYLTVLSLAALLTSAGCAGGASPAVLPVPSQTKLPQVSVSLMVPRPPAGVDSRGRAYISPATQAVKINTQAFNVSSSSPGCSPQSSGVSCQFTVNAPNLGPASFTVTTYDQPLSAAGAVQGNQLSIGSAGTTIVSGTLNVIQVTTLGTPAHIAMSVPNATPPMGTAITEPITYTVTDAGGYTIVGTFSTAIDLRASAVGCGVTVNGYSGIGYSSVSLREPGDTLVYLYKGTGGANGTCDIAGWVGNEIGKVTVTPQPAYGPELSVNTPLDGTSVLRMWSSTYFTEPAKHAIAAYEAGGAIAELQTPSGGTPAHISYGHFAQNDVSFTEDNDAVGTVSDTNGQFTIQDSVLPLTPNAGLYQIDLDDQVVSEHNTGKIAEYSNSGGWVEYSTGKPNSAPAGLMYAGTGTVAFADPGANAIAQFNPFSNTVTAWYPVPTAGARPTDIVENSGAGYLFTEPGINSIGFWGGPSIEEYACGSTPIALVVSDGNAVVLTSDGKIDLFSIQFNGLDASYKQIVPAASSSGPVVGIGAGGAGDLILLRSNGVTGSVQDFYYE